MLKLKATLKKLAQETIERFKIKKVRMKSIDPQYN